jgi:hypothetical protein
MLKHLGPQALSASQLAAAARLALAPTFRIGDRVMVVATGDTFMPIDRWRGTVSGFNTGLVEIKVQDKDMPADFRDGITKTFYIPPDQLAHTIGGSA